MEGLIQIEDKYNKKGILVKRTANGVPLYIPKELAPRVQFFDFDTEWVTEIFYMTKKEYEKRFGTIK